MERRGLYPRLRASGRPAPELLHRALHELLRVVELLENQGDIHPRLPGKPLAPAVHSVLTDERERVGQQVERDGQSSARASHHGLMMFQRIAMLVEDGQRSPTSWASTGEAQRGWASSAGCGAADSTRP